MKQPPTYLWKNSRRSICWRSSSSTSESERNTLPRLHSPKSSWRWERRFKSLCIPKDMRKLKSWTSNAILRNSRRETAKKSKLIRLLTSRRLDLDVNNRWLLLPFSREFSAIEMSNSSIDKSIHKGWSRETKICCWTFWISKIWRLEELISSWDLPLEQDHPRRKGTSRASYSMIQMKLNCPWANNNRGTQSTQLDQIRTAFALYRTILSAEMAKETPLQRRS